MTLEYGNYISQFPGLEFVKPDEFSQRYLAGTLDTFDAVFTHSSLEHSGLGKNCIINYLIFNSTKSEVGTVTP